VLHLHGHTAALAGDIQDNGRLPPLVIVVASDADVISVVNDAVEARQAADVDDDGAVD